MSALEYKSIPFEIRALTDGADGGWEIAGYASTFGGEPDFYGDVIAPGAFAASIASYPPKFLFEHVEPIGKTLEIREDEKGLYGRWSIVDTTTGSDAHKLAKAGVLDALSIGFFAEEYAYREDGVRILLRVDLPEVSAVAIPANRNAVITDVKHHRGTRPIAAHGEDARVAVRSWVARVRSGSELRGRDGKAPLTDERRALIAEMSGSLRSAADDLDALVATATVARPVEPRAYDLEALRARLDRLGVFAATGSDPT
jgi:HK97 family phage prohead protease